MKLYLFPGAPSPMRVELMLKYKGVELDTEVVNLREGGQFSEAFRSVNPRCTVPALVLDDGTCLSEVIAICLYLDGVYPQPPVFGRTDAERAHVVNWMHRIFNEGFVPAAEVLRNTSEAFRDRALAGPDNIAQIAPLAERGRQRLPIFFETLDRHLDGRTFIVGDTLSQADIDAWVVLYFARWTRCTPAESLTRLEQWRQRVGHLLGQEA